MNIYYSAGENRWFSNLASRPFTYDGYKYHSVEHAYHTLKSGMFDEETYNAYQSGGVKIRGKLKTNKKGNYNMNLMRNIIYESFKQNEYMKQMLLDTGDVVFTHEQENSVWKDLFPKLLMEVRKMLKNNNKNKGIIF